MSIKSIKHPKERMAHIPSQTAVRGISQSGQECTKVLSVGT